MTLDQKVALFFILIVVLLVLFNLPAIINAIMLQRKHMISLSSLKSVFEEKKKIFVENESEFNKILLKYYYTSERNMDNTELTDLVARTKLLFSRDFPKRIPFWYKKYETVDYLLDLSAVRVNQLKKLMNIKED